jgi:AcrR family transcriptional regulator
MSERMDRRREERRNRILDEAERLIAEKGVSGMTMEDVAKAADVAAGTPYLHFRNKNTLCAAAIARLHRQAADAEAERAAACITGSEKLLAYRKAMADFIVENPDRWKVIRQLKYVDLADAEDENVAELLRLHSQSIQLVAGFYRQGIEEGSIRPDLDPVPAAIFTFQALMLASDLPPIEKAMLQMNDVSPEQWLRATNDLLTMATHGRRPDSAHKRDNGKIQ